MVDLCKSRKRLNDLNGNVPDVLFLMVCIYIYTYNIDIYMYIINYLCLGIGKMEKMGNHVGGFLKWGYPNSCMIDFMENPPKDDEMGVPLF